MDREFQCSSPPTMISGWDSSSYQISSNKRKREATLGDESITESLTALSTFYSANSLQTPPSSSQTSHLEFYNSEFPFVPRNNSTCHARMEQSASKRLQLGPRPKMRPRLPLSSASSFVQASASEVPISPCHVCHRHPTTWTDLPSYADCEECHSRTCFVCIRTCEGPRCRSSTMIEEGPQWGEPATVMQTGGRNVCATCSIEVGREGRIWCLACYEDEEQPEIYSLGKTKKELQEESVGRIADWLNGCGSEAFET